MVGSGDVWMCVCGFVKRGATLRYGEISQSVRMQMEGWWREQERDRENGRYIPVSSSREAGYERG
jgi:hypothetical protein